MLRDVASTPPHPPLEVINSGGVSGFLHQAFLQAVKKAAQNLRFSLLGFMSSD